MMKMITRTLLIVLFFVAGKTYAQDLVYTPKNPAFGGNPYNYSWLMSSAQAQNDIKDPNSTLGYSGTATDPLKDFSASLNRQILNELSRQIVAKQFGESALKAGKYSMGDYQIEVSDNSSGLQVTIQDTRNGSQTTVTVPYF
jgi:curli production assembly/transport component CsgF